MQENGKHFRDMDIPDGKYVFSTTGLGGRLSIDVSAEIDRPDVDSIAIYRVKAGGFTQDVVSKAFNCLFGFRRRCAGQLNGAKGFILEYVCYDAESRCREQQRPRLPDAVRLPHENKAHTGL